MRKRGDQLMQTYVGYIENGLVVPIDMPREPDGRRVIIKIPELAVIPEEENASTESITKWGTLEYLFRDYDATSFQTELADLGAPVGNEQW
jgi:hypothetical protein